LDQNQLGNPSAPHAPRTLTLTACAEAIAVAQALAQKSGLPI